MDEELTQQALAKLIRENALAGNQMPYGLDPITYRMMALSPMGAVNTGMGGGLGNFLSALKGFSAAENSPTMRKIRDIKSGGQRYSFDEETGEAIPLNTPTNTLDILAAIYNNSANPEHVKAITVGMDSERLKGAKKKHSQMDELYKAFEETGGDIRKMLPMIMKHAKGDPQFIQTMLAYSMMADKFGFGDKKETGDKKKKGSKASGTKDFWSTMGNFKLKERMGSVVVIEDADKGHVYTIDTDDPNHVQDFAEAVKIASQPQQASNDQFNLRRPAPQAPQAQLPPAVQQYLQTGEATPVQPTGSSAFGTPTIFESGKGLIQGLMDLLAQSPTGQRYGWGGK